MSDNYSDGYIYVDYAHMSNAADDLVSQTKAIATTLSNLEMEIQELLKSWEGDDRDAYGQKQAKWNAAVKEMETMLTQHIALLNDVSGNYKYSENSLTQMWQSVAIGR